MKKRNYYRRFIIAGIVLILLWMVIIAIMGYCYSITDPAIYMQLISSFILALPSIGICAYAAFQTDRYAELDAERLRPELLMRSAEISMCMVNGSNFDQWLKTQKDMQEEKDAYRQYKGKYNEKYGEKSYLGYITICANLRLHTGESISEITIQKIEMDVGNESFLISYTDNDKKGRPVSFERNYVDSCEEYGIKFCPGYPDDPEEQESFWDTMYNAIVSQEFDVAKRTMEWRVHMNISYGMNQSRAGEKSLRAVWKMKWDESFGEEVNRYTVKRTAKGGIVSAEIDS